MKLGTLLRQRTNEVKEKEAKKIEKKLKKKLLKSAQKETNKGKYKSKNIKVCKIYATYGESYSTPSECFNEGIIKDVLSNLEFQSRQDGFKLKGFIDVSCCGLYPPKIGKFYVYLEWE